MKVLLLGASGFIGKAILNELLERGHQVIAIEHKSKVVPEKKGHLTVVRTSIGGLDIGRLPFQPETIIHAARNNAGRFGWLGRTAVAARGYFENTNLLRQLKSGNTPRLIYISGSLMYGSHPGKLVDENFPTTPVSFARAYVHAEKPFLNELRSNNPNVTMLRVPWVIGNGSWFKWNYTNIMSERNIVPLYSDGNNKMTFIDVSDIAKSVGKLMNMNFAGILNLYHPNYLTQQEWATFLSEAGGLPIHQFSQKEMLFFGSMVKQAFETEICLTSKHKDIQKDLQDGMFSIPDIIKKYLPSRLQNV